MYSPYGINAAIVTPMHPDESINLEELSRQVHRSVAAGIHGVFCLGTNGEFYALTTAERVEVMEAVVKTVAGRVPVLAMVGAISTRETVELASAAERIGVDALSVITPYFVPATQTEMEEHYRAVAAAVKLPVLIYNIPMRTGNHITPETVATLASVPNIVGIKDSSGDLEKLRAYIAAAPPSFTVLAGNDSLILPGLRAGAKGAIAGMANIVPEQLVRLYESWKAGDQERADELQAMVDALRKILSPGNPNTAVKRAVELLGYAVGPARRPVSGNPAELDARIRPIMAAAGLLPVEGATV